MLLYKMITKLLKPQLPVLNSLPLRQTHWMTRTTTPVSIPRNLISSSETMDLQKSSTQLIAGMTVAPKAQKLLEKTLTGTVLHSPLLRRLRIAPRSLPTTLSMKNLCQKKQKSSRRLWISQPWKQQLVLTMTGCIVVLSWLIWISIPTCDSQFARPCRESIKSRMLKTGCPSFMMWVASAK